MNFKKIVFSLLMTVAFIVPNFANTNPTIIPSSKAIDEIREIIQKIDFDQTSVTINKAQVYFMVNSQNEVIVIQTSSEQVDSTIKRNLNYKTLKNRDIPVDRVFTLPIRFEKK